MSHLKIITFDKGGRSEREANVSLGKAPMDFFYGVLHLTKKYNITRSTSVAVYSGPLRFFSKTIEYVRNNCLQIGLSNYFLRKQCNNLSMYDVVVSFTDGFSLSLGFFYRKKFKGIPFLIGYFHGLSDIELRAPKLFRPLSRKIIKAAVNRLDYVVFFGPGDQEEAKKRYSIDSKKIKFMNFGVDISFWTPTSFASREYIFSIGQDENRDYDLLLKAKSINKIKIHTAKKILNNSSNFQITYGSFQNSSISDLDLRDLYRDSSIVIIPLKDVFQPSGQSVCLQAMACGKPVIMTKTKGFWAEGYLISGKNCILVPPSDLYALNAAIALLEGDEILRSKIGEEARRVVEKYFNCEVAAENLRMLLDSYDGDRSSGEA